ncbi:MAG TPA: hypothetical protein DCP91_12370, partial [Eggerthellaceae bacterium]|nr:hypothetical protein [Eggerthellaceae bacterium]
MVEEVCEKTGPSCTVSVADTRAFSGRDSQAVESVVMSMIHAPKEEKLQRTWENLRTYGGFAVVQVVVGVLLTGLLFAMGIVPLATGTGIFANSVLQQVSTANNEWDARTGAAAAPQATSALPNGGGIATRAALDANAPTSQAPVAVAQEGNARTTDNAVSERQSPSALADGLAYAQEPASEADGTAEAKHANAAGEDAEAEADASHGAAGASSSSAASAGSARSAASAPAGSADREARAQSDDKTTIEKTIKTAEGKSIVVSVAFDEQAGIPDDAELSVVQAIRTPEGYDPKSQKFKNRPFDTEHFLTAREMNARTKALADDFEVRDDEYLFHTSFLEIDIQSNGKSVVPASEVEVTIETSTIDATVTDALEVARYEGNDPDTHERIYEPLGIDNQSTKKSGAKLVFYTDTFSEFALAGIATPLISWESRGADITVLGSWRSVVHVTDAFAEELEGDAWIVEAFQAQSELKDEFAKVREADPGYEPALWLSASPFDDPGLEETGALEGYRLNDGAFGDRVFASQGTKAPATLKSGEGIALVWDPYALGGRVEQGESDGAKSSSALADYRAAWSGMTAGQLAVHTLDQTLTASDGNEYRISVTFDATAGIPDGAQLVVSEIREDAEGYDAYVAQSAAALGATAESVQMAKAFDISLIDPATDQEYQPNANVAVSIELLKDDLNNYANVDVVHIPDGAGEDARVMDATVRGESVDFETDGFSVYVLIGSDGQTVTPQSTYTFWIPNEDAPGTYKEYSFTDSQGRTVFKQTITSGEELIVPQLASTDTEVFAGWYKGSTIGGSLTLDDEPYNFDSITITENSAVDLYAVYKSYATVIFHDQYDSDSKTFPVAYTRRAELVTAGEGESATTSATVNISDLSTTYTSSGGAKMAFFGWSETPITTPGAAKDDEGNDVAAIFADAEGCITVSGEKHLYPIFREVHRLSYYAAQSGKGADYVPPADYFAGDAIPVPLPTTAMDGFTFGGWYTGTLATTTEGSSTVETVNYGAQITNADGSLVSSADDAGAYISAGKLYLRADTTLYAYWTAATTADYQVVVWRQNPSDADGLEDENKTYSYAESAILTGTIGASASVPAEYTQRSYEGYSYSRCDDAKSITADGGLVLNVYYDKNSGYVPSGSYTLTFVDSVTEAGKTSESLPVNYPDISYDASIADKIPEEPTSGRSGYVFSNWYLDQACTIPANLSKMPDHDLTVYAGWETGWYMVTIDPNYGALYAEENGAGTGATWFWSSFEGEPIGEYTHVTRDYVESSSGTWYFVDHSGDGKGGSNGWADRHTYYTQNPALATEDTTFEYAPGVYTYAGWYEVYLDADGNEIGEAAEPYDFSQHTDHNTKLRLHWKKEGAYYLAYDAGDGTLEDGTKSALLPEGYADYAEVALAQSAIAPAGYAFVGWQVRGDDSATVYAPGQTFTLHADDAKRVSGKDVVYLDAVYAKVGTAAIVYNANGGTVAENDVNFGKAPDSATDEWNAASGTVDATAGTATVSGLVNNSKFKLSDGTGFSAPSGSNATFLGWSDKAVCDDSATYYSNEGDVIYGVSEATTLYAVWGAQVTYNLNSADANWGDEAWDTAVYTRTGDAYSQTANLGTTISEPDKVPVYAGEDGRLFRYWATRTATGDEANPYSYTEYDFSQQVTGALDLYAYWGEANTVPVHAVDASAADLEDKTGADGWNVTDVTVSATETALNGASHVTTPSGDYEFAFVAVASDLDSIFEDNAVTAIKYENKKIQVQYAGESTFSVLDEGEELYFVYYQKKALNIGYKSMASSGVLENATTSEAPTATDALLGEYNMSSQLTAPLDLASGFTNYAFAIGSVDAGGETQMNASNLSLITNAVGPSDPVPTLRVRNAWRGFEYATEAGDNAVWTSCGYAPQLYVVYYSQQPTVVMFDEKTVGTGAVMDTPFTFDLLVTEATTTTVSVQAQTKNDSGEWEDSGDPTETTTTGTPETIFDTAAEGNQPYILKNGEANSSILFYSETISRTEGEDNGGNTREVTTTTTVTAQTARITQTANDAFTTAINGAEQESEPYRYTYTATGSGGTQNVAFTNTHKALPVEVHVAMVENDGTNGGIIQRDTALRNATEANYKFDLALGTSETLLAKLPAVAYSTTEGEGDEA